MKDIKSGYKKVLKFKSCVSIIEYEDPIEIALRYNSNSKLVTPLFKNLSSNKTNSKMLENIELFFVFLKFQVAYG